jgi:hypothetical protein
VLLMKDTARSCSSWEPRTARALLADHEYMTGYCWSTCNRIENDKFSNMMLVVRGLEFLCVVSKGLVVVLDSRPWKMPKHNFVIPRLAPSTLCRLS